MSTPQSVLAQVPAVLVKRDFLDPSDLNSLLSASIAAEGDYKPSLVSQYDQSMLRSGRVNEKSRQSMQRKLEDRFAKLIVDKVVSFQDDIRNTIGVAFPELHGFEVEAVNSGDGAFFLTHIDTIHGELAHKRVISSVCTPPRSFRIADDQEVAGGGSCSDRHLSCRSGGAGAFPLPSTAAGEGHALDRRDVAEPGWAERPAHPPDVSHIRSLSPRESGLQCCGDRSGGVADRACRPVRRRSCGMLGGKTGHAPAGAAHDIPGPLLSRRHPHRIRQDENFLPL